MSCKKNHCIIWVYNNIYHVIYGKVSALQNQQVFDLLAIN